jgi:putative ABC transport system ATP-binding protein
LQASDRLSADFPASARTARIRFDLALGQCLVVRGPSGVGKTTVLRKIADLDVHDGKISLGNRPQADWPAPEWRRRVMYVASDSGWWAPSVASHFDTVETPQALMEQVGLGPEKLTLQPHQLSSGERQRMALVRALVKKPDFLLLDEPTSALDKDTTALVETMLGRFKQSGGGLIIVTHDDAQAERMADDRLVIARAEQP